MRLLTLAVGLTALVACAKPPPPPAAASAPIALDGAHSRLDAVESDKYLHYAVGQHIDAPPETVWAVLTDVDDFARWNSTVTSLEGTLEQGGQVVLTSRAGGKRKFKLEVSTFNAPRTMVWEDGNNAFRGVRTFTLTPRDGGTDFTMKEAMSGSMMKMIAKKLPDFGPDFDDFAADLAREAESR
jgi:uncharacterized protein YndB with AHSA1/START domain